MSTKPTNPKDAIGSSKIPLHLFPSTAKVYGTLGLLDGMLKYGRTNWRAAGIRTSIYYDAINRHLDAWFEGEDIDPDSGLPHLAHAIAGIAILIDGTEKENITDDRMYPTNYRQTMNRLSPEVERLKEKHDETPHHWTIADMQLELFPQLSGTLKLVPRKKSINADTGKMEWVPVTREEQLEINRKHTPDEIHKDTCSGCSYCDW
jgi:hypothetical protein